jgi:iron complex transport system ATP-binding protein
MSDSGLVAEHVWFSYEPRQTVLEDVTTAVRRGGLVGILGPNGSGKTTLLRLLGGLLSPTGGTIRLDGSDLHTIRRRDIARRVALVPQETQLAFEYTVLEMAMMGRYPHLGAFEVEGPEDVEIAREALRATGTLSLESRLFNTLSGGEKQRVVIAGALTQRPQILLLDEPTASLDLAYQLEIRSILCSLNRDHGLTIVISTHDVNLAAGLCRELILLDRGRILAAGPTESMLDSQLIRKLYGVEVEIANNPNAGQLTVIPIARAAERPRS